MHLGLLAFAIVSTLAGETGFLNRTVVVNGHAYPYVVYESRPTYYVSGRWYFHDGSRWVYYRREPPYLYRQRTYVRRSPPAYRRPEFAAPPPRYAPPAERVR